MKWDSLLVVDCVLGQETMFPVGNGSAVMSSVKGTLHINRSLGVSDLSV